MATGQRYERLSQGQLWRRYERSTGETVEVFAPVSYFDDFLAPASTTAAAVQWVETETGSGTVDFVADTDGFGLLRLQSPANASDDVAQLASELALFNVTGGTTASKNFQFETKLRITYNTGASMAGKQVFAGLIGGTIPTVTGTTTYGALTQGVGFIIGDAATGSAPGNEANIYCKTDDTTNDNAVDSGTDFVDDTFLILRFDATDPADVKFYINGSRVAAGSTFDISNLTASEAQMKLVFGVLSHTTEGNAVDLDVDVDYVKVWSTR